ncbi:MAG TPA: 2'-deoxycytidine 5'-triphosphate deaminase [Bosea sp. (in: a-proteobacteria)]|jgi:dCTP deaminase|uniref:2'-deoxycytidine 5'-triphosphate deaminase n=1 Tax=Bosea sp. (in: a-proteobacteria) TaxID=1871050 RepID=UPI002E0F3F38|nr:2'-deoxycytidine 5'-triphosphate deaminase [Bosea sp. (in: a-proteobacteria)]
MLPFKPGIQPDSCIRAFIEGGAIRLAHPPADGQIQPASLDLRLGEKAYRVRASFLPGPERTVRQRLDELALHEIDLSKGAVLETDCVYVAELMEGLALPAGLRAAANPKSSTGRLDVFTRVITDRSREFDLIEDGYEGPLFIEISPRTFPVLVRSGSRLSQIRFRAGETKLDDRALGELHQRETLVSAADPSFQSGVAVSVDLSGFDGLIGYRGKHHTALIDVDRVGAYRASEFWEPIHADGSRSMILDPGQFYILASKEAVHVPPDYAAEMTPFDALVGEFRVHYAGFFDPGFGHSAAGGQGARAVLEVRSRDVPFIIEDGQIVGRLVYEAMAARPAALYGAGLKSNYQGQALKLSKHFKD